MAKVGEGDPRWIVQNREDGKNVNNWHWTETDCMAWSKKTITSLLTNVTFLDDPSVGSCKTNDISSISGECTASNRKGKTIFFYELDVRVNWEGKLSGSEVLVKGKINVPYISEDTADDKMEVQVTTDGSGSEQDRVKEMVRSKGVPVVQKKVAEFLKGLREEYTIKPPSQSTSTPPPSESSTSATSATTPATTTSATPTAKPAATKSTVSKATKTIKIKDTFMGSPEQVYNMMILPDMLNIIMQGSAKMEPKEGGKFSLFGGSVVGENITLVPGSKIVQKWRFSDWPEGHHSTVEINITPGDGKTIVNLTQKDVPSDDAERTEFGWKGNFWGRGKQIFGIGSGFLS